MILFQSDLSNSNLSGSILDNVDLRGANLKGTVLVNSSLRMANMEGAIIYKTDFTGADLTDADIDFEGLDNSFIYEAVGLNKESVGSSKLYNLAATYYLNKKYLMALQIFEIAIQKSPNESKLRLSKAIINYELGNINESISELEIAAGLYRNQGEEESSEKILEFKKIIYNETKSKRKVNLNIAKALTNAFFLFKLI